MKNVSYVMAGQTTLNICLRTATTTIYRIFLYNILTVDLLLDRFQFSHSDIKLLYKKKKNSNPLVFLLFLYEPKLTQPDLTDGKLKTKVNR